MFERVARIFRENVPAVEFCSLRLVREAVEDLVIQRGTFRPPSARDDAGAMITVIHQGGLGYAGTSDLSEAGLRAAIDRARDWAQMSAGLGVFDFSSVPMPHPTGEYRSPVEQPFHAVSIKDKLDMLQTESTKLKIDPRIVHWGASMMHIGVETLYLTSGGGRVRQSLQHLAPDLQVVASDGRDSQQRSLASLLGFSQQGGLEVLARAGFFGAAARVAREAIELLEAPQCPAGQMDLLLDSDQMVLQIHESIGHPLELDRILGDERNYAGTSFVKPEMFGHFQYGSEHLNITFDPTIAHQFASYGFDDDGLEASRQYLIKDGLLVRPLGGLISQHRSGLSGVANSRASSWNRPPIDRMANINLEPGDTSLDDLIGSVERGVYMCTNRSWSIDDSRDKFQFGCQFAREIVDGTLGRVVRNPNYRGRSSSFWRSLKGVGDRQTRGVHGTPFCGKGEPNQAIRVGHATPACLFGAVDVFGGAG